LIIVAAIGLAFGLAGQTDGLEWDSSSSSLRWSALMFGFFFAAETLFAVFERMSLGFGTRLRWVADRNLPTLKAEPRRYLIERYFAAFIVFIGVGFAVSSTWMHTHEFWIGFPLIGAGLGLWLGVRTSRRILKLSETQKA
jgi:hypothetical protein